MFGLRWINETNSKYVFIVVRLTLKLFFVFNVVWGHHFTFLLLLAVMYNNNDTVRSAFEFIESMEQGVERLYACVHVWLTPDFETVNRVRLS